MLFGLKMQNLTTNYFAAVTPPLPMHAHTWSNGWLTSALLRGGFVLEAVPPAAPPPPYAPEVNPKGSPATAVLGNQGAAGDDDDCGVGPA